MTAAATEHYFDTLFGRRPPGSLIAVSSKSRGWAADFYDDAQAAAAACAGGVDVYARVTPLRERPPKGRKGTRGRGDADLSAALAAVWAELDVRGTPDGRGGVKADGFETVEHALDVATSVVAPTLAVGSGGGVHPYVVLAEPLVIASAADLQRAGELVWRYQQAIRAAAGGIAIDSSHDLARVLRPPGTFNGKGDEPRPVDVAVNSGGLVAVGELEAELPPLKETASGSGGRKRAKRKVTVNKELVARTLAEHAGLETLSARSGGDPSAHDYGLACAAARDGLEPNVIEQLVAHRLMRHGDPKGKASARDDYVPETVKRALAAVERTLRDEALGDPLEEASVIIDMEEEPIVEAEERRSGRVVLKRADERVLRAGALGVLAKYDRRSAELAAQFGHELVVEKGMGARTAVRFVAALRRHFGPGYVRTLEDVVEDWLIDLVRVAGETVFVHGDTDSKLAAWKELDELEPTSATPGATAFAKKVVIAHDTSTGDRYLRASWAQEYLRRCGWRNGPEEAVDMLLAIGLEQPNADGRVAVRRRADDEFVELRFWIIPKALYEGWAA